MGLKHPLLFSLYFIYIFLGGTAFFLIESEEAAAFKLAWKTQSNRKREDFLVRKVLPQVFNNSRFLVFVNAEKTAGIQDVMEDLLKEYETSLGVRPPMPVYDWNFQNSFLFACGLATTIGYGFLYPMTRAGRIATILFQVMGIPFTLVLLQDLAGLLAKLLNYPGLVLGKCWSVFRFCTLPAVSEEKLHLSHNNKGQQAHNRRPSQGKLIFETILNTPTLIAVFALVGWIFAASFTFCVWETEWSLLMSFYFCFNSLTTAGIGDVQPSNPDLHLFMFLYIYVGLAVVSLFINLIYAKLTRAYWIDLDPRYPYRALPASYSSTATSPTEEIGRRNTAAGRRKGKYIEVGVGCDTVDGEPYIRRAPDPTIASSPAYVEAELLPETPAPHSLPRKAPVAPTETTDTYETYAEMISTSDLDLGSCVTLGILQMQDRKPLLDAIKRTGAAQVGQTSPDNAKPSHTEDKSRSRGFLIDAKFCHLWRHPEDSTGRTQLMM